MNDVLVRVGSAGEAEEVITAPAETVAEPQRRAA